MDVDQEGSSSPMEVGNVSAMTVKMKEELEVHRMRGHIPFMSGCPHCQKTRGVTQHRRGKDVGNRPVELQADFCFINLVTGTFVKDQPNAPNMKIFGVDRDVHQDGWLCPCRDKCGSHIDLDQVLDECLSG